MGATAALLLALLDLFGVALVDGRQVTLLILGSGAVGFGWGWCSKLSSSMVASSVDARGGLADRLTSANGPGESEFQTAVREDATQRIAAISPKDLYPVKVGRTQAAMMCSVVLPVAVLVISYNHLLLSAEAKAERMAEKKAAAVIERVLRPVAENPKLSPQETDLVKKLQRLSKDMDRGKLDRSQLKEQADRIAQEAERLMHEENKDTTRSLDSAQSAMDRMQKDKNLASADPADRAAGLTGKESEQELRDLAAKSPASPQAAQAENAQLQQKISELQKSLEQKSSLTAAQRAAKEKELSELQSKLKQLQLSEAARKMLERMQNNPEYKKMQEMLRKLQQNASKMETGSPGEMSDDDIKKMEQQLEQMAKELKSDADMKKAIEAMEKALEEAKAAGNMDAVASLLSQMNMGGAPDTTPGPSNGAPLNMSDKEEKGEGTTHVVGARADQGPNAKPAPYIELRGLAKLNGPSGIPMLADVPASKRKAEEAIDRQRIPKEHRERVRRYFESLEGHSSTTPESNPGANKAGLGVKS